MIKKNHVEGIFSSGSRQDDESLIGQLSDIPFVESDATAGAKLAVPYLSEWEHQRIGIITNAPIEEHCRSTMP